MKGLLTLLLLARFPLYSQFQVSIQQFSDVEKPSITKTYGDHNFISWNARTGYSLHIDVPVTSSIFISPSVGMKRFTFENHVFANITNSSAVLAHNNSYAEDAQLSYYALDVKLFAAEHEKIRPYVQTGITLMNIQYGSLTVNVDPVEYFQFASESISYAMHSFGFGTTMYSTYGVGIDMNMTFLTNYSNSFYRYLSIGLGYKFN